MFLLPRHANDNLWHLWIYWHSVYLCESNLLVPIVLQQKPLASIFPCRFWVLYSYLYFFQKLSICYKRGNPSLGGRCLNFIHSFRYRMSSRHIVLQKSLESRPGAVTRDPKEFSGFDICTITISNFASFGWYGTAIRKVTACKSG